MYWSFVAVACAQTVPMEYKADHLVDGQRYDLD
jgi:hypothetical protein